jgi:hypothetical protein
LTPPAPPQLRQVQPEEVVTDILDRDALGVLAASGFGLHDLLGISSRTIPSASWLSSNVPRYASLTGLLTEEVEQAASQLSRDLVVEHRDALAWPAGNVGRRLDPRWFSATEARWDLVAVINRLDRIDFSEGTHCGEVRFIYRLGYQADGAGSRLPVTLNVVMRYPHQEDCGEVARRWVAPLDTAAAFDGLHLTQVEVNAQAVRFPSGVETEFGGQALYLLAVAAFDEQDRATLQPLENTPDARAIAADPARKAALLGWIGDELARIDEGAHVLPEAFAARRALSWSTLGINRSANKPFTAIFSPTELPEVPAGVRGIGSQVGLLERLDNSTCTGCHQAGSAAGFHLLGLDDPDQSGVTNRLQLPTSPHYLADQARRRAYTAALASGQEPDRFRPHSLAPIGYSEATSGGNCLPAAHTGDLLGGWGCPEGLSCEIVVRDPDTHLHFGQCVVPRDQPEALRSGMLCREGTVTPAASAEEGAFNAGSDRDVLVQVQRHELPENKSFTDHSYNCRPPVIGVPLGRAYRSCTAEERALTAGTLPDEICAVVGGGRFDRCVEEDFHSCLSGIVARGMVDGCSASRPCREDYICQRLPWQLDSVPTEVGAALSESGTGFCTPTYFLFQLRLDGHPVPTVL